MNILNKIIVGDCVEHMRLMPENCIDLTVTSPPYDNLRTYNGYSFDFENVANELYRITKHGGIVVWVVGDATIKGSETGTSFKQALFFKEVGFNLHDTMIYKKTGTSFPDANRYLQNFEYMFVFSKGSPSVINLIKDRKNKYVGSVGGNKRGGLCKREEYGSRFNVWEYATGKHNSTKDYEYHKHPAIFPEQLAEDHIVSWSNFGDIVFDPMCGSGTTLKMAKKNGRNFIGIDISSEYVELAQKRVEYL